MKPMIKGFLLFFIMILGFNLISITQGRSTLKFTQGTRYDYAVLCTDYCGSKVWDATNLDANLFFSITKIDEIQDEVSL